MPIHMFSDLEGLRIAVEMEERGHAFYSRASNIAKSPAAIALLKRLAQDENRHRGDFTRLYERALSERDAPSSAFYGEEVSAYLSAVAADVVFPGGLVGIAYGLNDQEAILKDAIQSEKDAILFYTEMIGYANEESTKRTFTEIMRQERAHLRELQDQLLELRGAQPL